MPGTSSSVVVSAPPETAPPEPSPLEVITRRRAEGVFIRLEPVAGGYLCRVREDLAAGEWTTLDTGSPPGHTSPEDALRAIDTAITEWLVGRESAVDAEVVAHLQRGHLQMRKFRNEEGAEEDRWAARRGDGTWTEGHAEPRAAVRAALARAR
jgi:hypothetical protein